MTAGGRVGGREGGRGEAKDIERDILRQSFLPLSIYSLRKAMEGQSRRREAGHH